MLCWNYQFLLHRNRTGVHRKAGDSSCILWKTYIHSASAVENNREDAKMEFKTEVLPEFATCSKKKE